MRQNNSFKLDFVGIGAQRAATTWLAECLREHPQICLAHPKELGFFDSDKYNFGLDWYKKHFNIKPSHRVCGEFTSTYIYSQEAAVRLKKNFPALKIIVSLRNPIDRHISHNRTKPLDRGLYFKHLKPYFELFPRENILVLLYEDIKKDPGFVLARIFKFLGVDVSFKPPSLNEIINPSKTYRVKGLKNLIDKIIMAVERKKAGVYLKKFLLKIGARRAFYAFDKANTKDIVKKEADEQERAQLREFYKQDVRQLELLLNKKLWPDISQ